MTSPMVPAEKVNSVPTLEMEGLFNLGLPKWPQLMIVGESVTKEQAMDIIFRTDDFLTESHEWGGGNNKRWIEAYRRRAGITEIKKPFEKEWPNDIYRSDVMYVVRERIGFVPLQYVYNRWASSAFIGGPCGFCSPDGKIYFHHNIGKWPSVEDVYQDFVSIAQAFPYVKLKASLYDGESCEKEAQHVVSFVVDCGTVYLTKEDFDLRSHSVPESIEEQIGRIMSDRSNEREQGLDDSWIKEYQRRIKELIPQAEIDADLVYELREKFRREQDAAEENALENQTPAIEDKTK